MTSAKKLPVKFVDRGKLSSKRRMRLWLSRLSLISKIAFCVILYFLLFTAHLGSIKEYVRDSASDFIGEFGFRLQTVAIKGNKHIDSNYIVSLLNADVGTPLFSIKLDEVYKKLRHISWVKNVTLQRKLPDTIVVYIEEKEPIAIWQHDQKLFLIDVEGNVVGNDRIGDFANLVHVVGSDANLQAAKLIEDMKQYPGFDIVAAVRYGERRWNLILAQNIVVKMPEKDFRKALEYLAKLHKQGKLFDQNYKTIDLRDHAKYYVEKHAVEKGR